MDKKLLLITMAINTTIKQNININKKLIMQINSVNTKENNNQTVLKQFSKEAKLFYEEIRLASTNKTNILNLDKKNFFLHLSKFLLGLSIDHFSDIDYSLVADILMDEYASDAKPKYANLAISNFKKTKKQSEFINKVKLFLIKNKELLINNTQECNLQLKKTLTLSDVRKSEGKLPLKDTATKLRTEKKVITNQSKIHG